MKSVQDKFKVLLAFDLVSELDSTAEAWSEALVKSLVSDGCEVTILTREMDSRDYHSILESCGATIVLPPATDEKELYDEFGALPRLRARQVVQIASKLKPDLTLIQGEELSYRVLTSNLCPDNVWVIPECSPAISKGSTYNEKWMKVIGENARLVLASDENIRGTIEAHHPTVASKTRLLPPLLLTAIRKNVSESLVAGPRTYVIDANIFNHEAVDIDFAEFAELARNRREVPRVVLCGARVDELSDPNSQLVSSRLLDIPGIIIESRPIAASEFITPNSRLLMPTGVPPQLRAVLEHSADSNSLELFEISGSKPLAEGFEFVGEAVEERVSTSNSSFLRNFPVAFPDYMAQPLQDERIHVVLAGADFKFAGDLAELLLQRGDVEVRLDVFENNSTPQPVKSSPFLRWADVIIAEFASFNAIWYSQNKLPHQKLIVHLHGYELLSDWIDELDIERVDRIVVASHFYRDKALAMKNWPEEKVIVIPNSVNFEDLNRAKFAEARFHLGIVGIVPILKRPDRAIQLLEKLVEVDPRYVLHIKGHAPWNYTWEWKKAAHQDAYRAFYKRLGEKNLLAHVAFEPFTPDVGNWFRKIGWILSPSYRETFHMAAIEGGASGAIPIAWERDGSVDIIGGQFNVSSTDEAFSRIVEVNVSENQYNDWSVRAKQFMERYSLEFVRNLWLEEILMTKRSGVVQRSNQCNLAQTLSAPEQNLYDSVLDDLSCGDVEAALVKLDERIKLTVGKTGILKDLELYVRGLAISDENRLNHYIADTESLEFETPLVLRVKGENISWLRGHRFERMVYDIDLPAHLKPRHALMLAEDDIQPDYSTDQISTDADLRFDRWVQLVKAAIISHFLHSGADSILAVGSWPIAFAGTLAADQLGIRFGWSVDSDSLDLLNKRQIDRGFNDAEYQLALSTWDRSDVRIVADKNQLEGLHLVGSVDVNIGDFDLRNRYELLDVSLGVEKAVQRHATQARPSLKNSLGLSFQLKDLTIAVVAGEAFIQQLRPLVKKVIEIPIVGYFEEIDAFVDAVLIDTSANKSGPWKNRVQYHKAEGRYPIAKILDHARQLGVASAVIDFGEHTVEPKYFAAVRKSDCICVSWLPALPAALELNPSVIRSAIIWSNIAPFELNLRMLLRSMGIPVEKPHLVRQGGRDLSAEKIEKLTNSDVVASELDRDGALKDEMISVILATFRGEQTISKMLDSISAQTLPVELIELIVVENGQRSETASIVREFAERNPGLSVTYLFEEVANVGHARNVGIERATGKYITFVDDDDYLEPNYLLSMWLSASDESLVIGLLADESLSGERNIETPNNNRVFALEGGRHPLRNRSGLLGLNACKLIPSRLVKQISYEVSLPSGEDTVFMSQLLRFEDLDLVPCSPMARAMYVRRMSENSISRQPVSFNFCVEQRVDVINCLIKTRDEIHKRNAGAINYLIDNQSSFIRKFYSENPTRQEEVRTYISDNCLDDRVIRLS